MTPFSTAQKCPSTHSPSSSYSSSSAQQPPPPFSDPAPSPPPSPPPQHCASSKSKPVYAPHLSSTHRTLPLPFSVKNHTNPPPRAHRTPSTLLFSFGGEKAARAGFLALQLPPFPPPHSSIPSLLLTPFLQSQQDVDIGIARVQRVEGVRMLVAEAILLDVGDLTAEGVLGGDEEAVGRILERARGREQQGDLSGLLYALVMAEVRREMTFQRLA
ncbi:MAG: hypothetical protein M1829_006059 [Trizodia sp. TS-e1964]|nr:MAG: hypothetical protein M1829_006059 [Trizodia sp. TS-e1964]